MYAKKQKNSNTPSIDEKQKISNTQSIHGKEQKQRPSPEQPTQRPPVSPAPYPYPGVGDFLRHPAQGHYAPFIEEANSDCFLRRSYVFAGEA